MRTEGPAHVKVEAWFTPNRIFGEALMTTWFNRGLAAGRPAFSRQRAQISIVYPELGCP